MQTPRSQDERIQLQSRIDAWLSHCAGLQVNTREVSIEQLQHYAVRLEEY